MPRRPSLAKVAAEGDHRATLIRLRQIVAAAIDADPPARDLAALARRLRLILVELDAVPEVRGPSVLDEIKARRAAREAARAAE